MRGTLFERLNKQIINPNYVLSPLNSENNIKGCDCRNVSDNVFSDTNTFGENSYKYERLKQLLIIKSRLFNLSPESINCIVTTTIMPDKGRSFEFENNIVTSQSTNTINALRVFVIDPLPVASGKNIKNGGLFDDFLLDI